eukprot:5482963-Amphidinium_carterae.1
MQVAVQSSVSCNEYCSAVVTDAQCVGACVPSQSPGHNLGDLVFVEPCIGRRCVFSNVTSNLLALHEAKGHGVSAHAVVLEKPPVKWKHHKILDESMWQRIIRAFPLKALRQYDRVACQIIQDILACT